MPGTLSVEELCERLAQRDELIEALQGEVARMRVRVAELEARLGQTSRNLFEAAQLGWVDQAGTEVAA